MDVEDNEEASKLDNYSISDVDLQDVDVDDDTVILSIEDGDEVDNQTEATVKVKKAILGEDEEFDVEFFDITIPKVLGAKVIGEDTIKVIFSEPMDVDTLVKDNFKVDDGDYYIKKIDPLNNNTEANIVLYSALEEGTVEVTVKADVEDYAGFNVLETNLDVEVVEDTEEPYVVGYKDATPDGITLIFNEEFVLDGDYEDIYHTNSKNTADDSEDALEVNGKELKVKFTENNLPEGIAYIYIDGGSIVDLWGNDNSNTIVYMVEVEVDRTAPEVDEIEVKDEDKIIVKFSEDLDEDSAEDDDNYTILDEDGEEVEDIIDEITLDGSEVTITFDEKLGGDYTLVVENVEDLAENKIEKTSVDFHVDDMTPPDVSKFEAILYDDDGDDDDEDEDQVLIVRFGEKMTTDESKYSVVDLEKYVVAGKILDDVDDVKIAAIEEDKAVKITIPSGKLDIDADDTVTVARVADAAGNYMVELSYEIDIDSEGYVSFKEDGAKATALDTIEVTFSDEFVDFESKDIKVRTVDTKTEITTSKAKTSVNSDNQTVCVITLHEDNKLSYDAKYNGEAVEVVAVGTESENAYGENLCVGDSIVVADKIAPALDKTKVDDEDVDYVVADNNDPVVALYFEEAIDPKTVSVVSFDIEDVTENRVEVDENVVYIYLDKVAAVEAEVVQNAFIKDVNGNKVEDIDTEIAKYEDIPDLTAKREKLEAIDEAYDAIEALPELDVLDLDDKAAVENARTLVEAALEKGANEEDITNLSDLEAAEAKIAELEAQKAIDDAVLAAETAIDALPELDALTLDDKAAVENARALVEVALEAGAAEEDITNLVDLEAAEAKIAELEEALNEEQAKQAVVDSVNSAENLVELGNALNSEYFENVDLNLIEEYATALDALEIDPTTIEEIQAVIDQVNEDAAIEAAIAEAEAAIDALPELDALTLDDKAAVENARALVEVALEAGAAEEDITNLVDLQAAEAKIDTLLASYEASTVIESLDEEQVVVDTQNLQITISSDGLTAADLKALLNTENPNATLIVLSSESGFEVADSVTVVDGMAVEVTSADETVSDTYTIIVSVE